MLAASSASCRVIPMVPALFVVWASEGRILKLRDAFSEPMFTSTPWLLFKYGRAARVR